MTYKKLLQKIKRATKKEVTELNLGSNQLTELPPEIGQLTSLTELDLHGNQLTELPPEIGQLTSLTKLYLYHNELTELPPEIGQLTSLIRIDLGGNQLTELPPEIGQLTSLIRIDLIGNQLTELPPEIGQLTSLTLLDLSGNQLTALPPEIGQLTSLTLLDLIDNQLTALPPEIGQLTSLTKLYLSGNQLTALPPEIGQLTSLIRIDLRDNPFPIPLDIKGPDAINSLMPYQTGQKRPLLVREIEFPPEYYQAGISILNYFGIVLRKKYPDQKVKVRIEQEDLKVTMTIDPLEGDREIIERTLDEYGLIVTGKMPLEKFTDDRFLIMELKQELRIAQARIENQKELMQYQDADIKELRQLLLQVTHSPAPSINITVPVNVTSKAEASSTQQISITPQISLIQGNLNELKERLQEGSEEAKSIQEIQNSLKEIKNTNSSEEVEKSSAMSKFRRFIESLDKAESKIGRTIKGIKDGIEIAQNLAKHYNSIAQWCGLPQVPKPFLKKKSNAK